MEELTLAADGTHIAARLYRPAAPAPSIPAVLFIHGLGSDQRAAGVRAERVAQRCGATCMTFDLRGHGESAGEHASLSVTDLLADAATAYDHLVAEPSIDAGRVGVSGSSFGGYLAARLVALRPIARLFLRAPVLVDDARTTTPIDDGLGSPNGTEATGALEDIAGYTGAVMVLESGADEIVEHETIETYLAVARYADHRVIEGATHRLEREQWEQAYVDALVAWFAGL